MPEPLTNQIINHLWKSTDEGIEPQIYAILDAARDEKIYPMILESGVDFFCLYRGEKAEILADVAPYLLKLERKSTFTERLIKNCWGKSWGIFLESPASLRELRQHFRSFLMVHDEGGKPLYFRFYDPRVLRVYLPTCNSAELKTLFGPVKNFHVEDEDTVVNVFSLMNRSLDREMVRLS